MLTAKSMYRGGMLVEAADCTSYEDSKNLGLICPFCSEPVFLKDMSARTAPKTKKIVLVRPHFSHYNGADGAFCEKRALTSEGKHFIEQMRIEKRNQRLDLFNKYFWELIADSHHYPRNVDKTIKKWISEEKLIQLTRHMQMWWSSQDEKSYKMIKKAYDHMTNPSVEDKETAKMYGELHTLVHYEHMTAEIDGKLQLAIAFEASDFLCTKKSGLAFRKMISTSIYCLENSDIPKPVTREDYLDRVASMIPCMLAGTDWVGQLEQKSKIQPKGFMSKVK